MVDLVVKNSGELELKMKKGGLGPPASFFRYPAFILGPELLSLPRRGIHIDRRQLPA